MCFINHLCQLLQPVVYASIAKVAQQEQRHGGSVDYLKLLSVHLKNWFVPEELFRLSEDIAVILCLHCLPSNKNAYPLDKVFETAIV